MEVRCQFPKTWICGRVGHVDTPLGELVVNRPALGRGTDHSHLTPTDCNQLAGSLNDPRVVSLSKHDPTANGRSPSF